MSGMCNETQPHIAHHACPGIAQDAVIQGSYERVLDWLMTDYECNGIDVRVGSYGPDWSEDHPQVIIDRNLWFEVELSEPGVFGDRKREVSPMMDARLTVLHHIGHGHTLDEASADALAMRDEYFEEMTRLSEMSER